MLEQVWDGADAAYFDMDSLMNNSSITDTGKNGKGKKKTFSENTHGHELSA